ncbi:transcription termination factor MTERF8, chloroplastic-like [Phalaenopsis equestris]|uniref:transcription termination factor MTERF8, chloroplastic-like n=1 Tax=Phalaenopsis equestris TaxID=78828 RepID=UPI0009E2AA06|nr:transcription termination factor MTERF8, chloroplastic-like [Phalaenopsis equestris]XP_020587444.1 transcription termination factor MTERF8, chloroplastic-like [Phalaenopsis equestris]
MFTTQLCSPLPTAETLIPPSVHLSPSHYPSSHSSIPRLQSTALSLSRSYLTTRYLTRIALTDASFSLSLFTELRLDQYEVDALLHRHPEIESVAAASPESLRLRIGTLLSIGLGNSALRRTIIKRPDILTSPEAGLFLNFVHEESVKLLPTKLERLLISTHSAHFQGLVIRTKLFLNHGFPHEKLGHLLNVVDIKRAFCEKTIEDIEEMILFLQRYGWPNTIVRRPNLLNLDLHNQLIPRAQFFANLAGGDEESSSHLIRKLPGILAYTVEHLQSHLEFWRSVGLTGGQLFKIALVYPNIFSVSIERKLSSRIDFLEQCGLDAEEIFKFLVKAPLFTSLSFEENLAKKLAFLVKLGYVYRTRDMALAVGAVTRTSTENMQKVIELFFSYGFSCEDVLAMSRKHPQVLQYNCESLGKKMQFLINDMEREVRELLSFPAFLGYNLDDRIRYRYEIKMANRGKGSSINNLLSVSDERFYLKTNKWIEAGSDCNSDQVKL